MGLHKVQRMNAWGDRELQRTIDKITKGPAGRKVLRNASRAALEVFNVETGDEAGKLKLKKSGKGWRKALTKLGNYKYYISARNSATFTAATGVNYKKAKVLNVTHLVEQGFKHFKIGKISGHWFRHGAFEKNYKRIMNSLKDNIAWGMNTYIRSGKVPSASQMRKRGD